MFHLSARRWYGLNLFPGTPVEGACWPNTPVYVASVEPLKTGQGFLRLGLVEVLQPIRPRRRTVTIRVRHRAPGHLVGTFDDAEGVVQTAVLSEIDENWVRQHCHDWWRRFPPAHFADLASPH